MDLKAFIDALPKAETHVHLEGVIPWAMARTFAPDGMDRTAPWLHSDYRFADFNDFIEVMQPGILYLRQSVESYGAVAAAYFRELVAQNVRYVEISSGFGLGLLNAEIGVHDIVAAMRSAIPPGLEVRIIASRNRRAMPPLDSREARILLDTSGIDGIDLHGDERLNGPCMFRDLYDAARERGYLLRAHAGELTGSQTIIDTLDCLGVTRIEHGLSAAQDEALIERLANDPSIVLEMCPTSNVKLRQVESLAAHPIGRLLRRGVRVTCSTDDPGVFGVSLTDELHNLAVHQQFTAVELATLQINAFQAALLSEDKRAALIAEVEALRDQFMAEA